jgi:hypothetical protein
MNLNQNDIPLDAELASLDAQLTRHLPVNPPHDLATRIYRATVADLPPSPVIARLGWSSWAGWRYAAAIAIVFFYSVLWVKPHLVPTTISEQEVALTLNAVQVQPAIALDQQISSVHDELDELAADLDREPAALFSYEDVDDSLSHELLKLEEQLDSAG